MQSSLEDKMKASANDTVPPQAQLNNLLEHYQNRRLGNAEELALSITQQYPEHAFSWKILGAIFGQTGRKSEAINADQRALQLAPQDPEAHNNLGITLKILGRLDDASGCFWKAIGIKPDYVEAHYNLGNTLQEQGKLEEAEASYRKAIALKHDLSEAYSSLGNTLNTSNRFKEAEVMLSQAIAFKPNYAEAHSNLGNTLQGLGRLDEAQASYTKAIALKPDLAKTHYNLGITLQELGRLDEAQASYTKAIALKPDFTDVFWNLHGIQRTIQGAEHWIDKCLIADTNHVKARLIKAALRFYQGDKSDYNDLLQSKFKEHPYIRSFSWALNLPNLPELHFERSYFFDAIVKKSIISRPFYEFGVFRGAAFKYLIKSFKKGYGFDTFTGLPEDWIVGTHTEKAGSYSNDGVVPTIKGGEFIVGKFEDTLPVFFSDSRPMASLINFDADLYSSTICALNFSKSVIDKDTILIFDEFIINENWEQDEFKALTEFCSINNLNYEVMAISFYTKQVAVKLIDI